VFLACNPRRTLATSPSGSARLADAILSSTIAATPCEYPRIEWYPSPRLFYLVIFLPSSGAHVADYEARAVNVRRF